MSTPFERRRVLAPLADLPAGGRTGLQLALHCARNVYQAIDRRAPEAGALAQWLVDCAAALSLSDAVIPGEGERFRRSRQAGVLPDDWNKIDTALVQAEAALSDAPEALAGRWCQAVAHSLELDAVETGILELTLYYKVDQPVAALFNALRECRGGHHALHRDGGLIALMLQTPPAEVDRRLALGAKLLASGVLLLDRHGGLDVLARLKSLLRQGVAPTDDFHGQLLGATVADPLAWECFAHLGREAEIAAAVLRAALNGRESGINVLLYGPPGTGKTSFAATLAAQVGATLRPVAEADEFGGEPDRDERLGGLRLAQKLVTPGNTLLLFDEAEDLFVSRSRNADEPVTSSRVFIHRLLERGAVPVLWTANDIGVLGPAVLRRMTMCLELKVPNLATRTRLWRRMGEAEGVVLAEGDAARLARLVPAAPAVASGALRATRLAGGGAETARLIVEGVARAVLGGVLPAPEPEPQSDTGYHPELVNAGCDLARLTADLLRLDAPRAVSFLLSGPPGAGKSAWVRYLAGRMGLPVLHKRASDLLNPFVGGTEQNIAGAFAEAREAQAFLVFDEADSLLLERADAVRSWEISQVNEMLTWMESHALPFACTTNLAERLDRASLRRFLVKLRFDWLTPVQARLAFRRFFDLAPPIGLGSLRTLTPADFALVKRRAAVRGGSLDPITLLQLLAAECDGRIGGRVPIGFARLEATG